MADPESAQPSAQPIELSSASGWVRLLLLSLEACHWPQWDPPRRKHATSVICPLWWGSVLRGVHSKPKSGTHGSSGGD